MKLKEQIQKNRDRHKIKEPLPETVWTAVAGIVKKFDLRVVPGEKEHEHELPEGTKPAARLSLFPLLDGRQRRLTREIMARYANPYLAFARSPAEISLSRRLYERNTQLTVEALRGQTLSELWAREGDCRE